MRIIHIQASPKQLHRLRKGGRVRIKAGVQGKGFNLIVNPALFDIMTRTFTRGKGMEIQLSPQEIAANQEASVQMGGQGIFGSKFDRYLEKKGLKEAAYKVGDQLKPAAKAALLGGLGAAATALAGTEFIATGGLGAAAVPAIYSTAATLGALGTDYLDNPREYQPKRNVGGPRNKIAHSTLEGAVKQNEVLSNLATDTGQNYSNLASASLSNALTQATRSQVGSNRVDSLLNTYNAGPTSMAPIPSYNYKSPHSAVGYGLRHKTREAGSVGVGGRFVGARHQLPPAMMSQPFSSNYQFKHTLPPSFAKWIV